MAVTLLVGGGNMGGALLAGWRARGMAPGDIAVVEPDAAAAERLAASHGVATVAEPDALAAAPETVVFAVKPQILAAVAPRYRRFAGPATAFLSIAAGKPIAFFEGALGEAAAVVRAMPNTPAAIHRAMTVACANPRVTAAQRARCGTLLEAVGAVAWVEDEALLDPVTAVSGSGPAYVFLLIEALAEAGIAAGLPRDLARRCAHETVTGAAELARLSEDDAATLRRRVTSPGGTTEAALAVLMAEDGLAALMRRAVAAAAERAKELAK